jgi:hypothetical protein
MSDVAGVSGPALLPEVVVRHTMGSNENLQTRQRAPRAG